MERIFKRALAVVCAAAMLGAGSSALAAEEAAPGISVQLDGKTLTFSDAAPQAKDGRTFLPVRAVFEAMGAQVSWSAADQTITAVRDDTTVTMTLGGTEATVERDGVTTPLVMDVAPYAEGGHTYVLVRFAAQAFGCSVGWDQDDQTVILIDAGKLLDEALAKHEFTYLERYMDYSQKYSKGIWDVEGSFDASMSLLGSDPMTMEGTMEGTTADATKMAMAMVLKMDLGTLLESEGGMSATDQEAFDQLKKDGIQLEMRGDLESGKLYYTMGGDFLEAAGMPADTWYSMDMAATYEAMGMDYAGLIGMAKDMDYTAMIASMLAMSAAPTDKDTAYTDLAAGVDLAAQLLSDDAWAVSGDKRILHYALEQEGLDAAIDFTLTMKGEDVVAYELAVTLSGVDAETGDPLFTMACNASMDQKDQMKASFQCSMPEVLEMELDMTGSYAQGKTAPVTAPPEGATVVDMMAGMPIAP